MGPSRAPRSRASGFTLIELMMVVAIIGILASIAAPAATMVMTKVRESEERTMAKNIIRSVKLELDRTGRFPANYTWDNYRFLYADFNPSDPYSGVGQKERFNPRAEGWRELESTPDGWVYYRYLLYVYDYPDYRAIYLYTAGDADRDGEVVWRARYYELIGNELQLYNCCSSNEPDVSWVSPPDEH